MRSAVREQRSHVILSDHGSSFGLGMGIRGRESGEAGDGEGVAFPSIGKMFGRGRVEYWLLTPVC